MTGMNGSAIINFWRDDCHIVSCREWEDKDVVPVVTAAGLTKTMAPRNENTIQKSEIPRPTSDVHEFYRNLCLAIDGKAEPIVTHAQQVRLMKIMEACFESDRLHAPVAIDDEIC